MRAESTSRILSDPGRLLMDYFKGVLMFTAIQKPEPVFVKHSSEVEINFNLSKIISDTILLAFLCVSKSEKGEVFVWGYGILGKGPKLSESSTPEMIPPTLFGRSEFSPSVAVTRIRCGLNHFAAVTGENVSKQPSPHISSLHEIQVY